MTLRTLALASIAVLAVAAAHAAGPAGQQPAEPPSTAQVDRGRQTFVRVGCYECHGREAQGASTGPRLGPAPLPLDAFTRAIRTPRNEMPPYGPRILSDGDIGDIYAFVRARPAPVAPAAGAAGLRHPLPPSLSPFVAGAGARRAR